jgi:glyoxylase-like metal-dependent hydrolase (beta-lactamase superfamily II)
VTGTLIVPVVDEGLGNSAYLADLGDGRALAVDASRDLRVLRQAASRRGLRIAFAADTHLHADFLTGAVQLAARYWTSGGRPSTSPGTSPARCTSSSATCRPACRPRPPLRW